MIIKDFDQTFLETFDLHPSRNTFHQPNRIKNTPRMFQQSLYESYKLAIQPAKTGRFIPGFDLACSTRSFQSSSSPTCLTKSTAISTSSNLSIINVKARLLSPMRENIKTNSWVYPFFSHITRA